MGKCQLSIERIERNVTFWQKAKRVWEKTYSINDGLNTFIYYTYLHDSSVEYVASVVNDLGYRIESKAGNQVKYKSTNISDIIRNADIEDTDLQEICRYVLSVNTTGADMHYN